MVDQHFRFRGSNGHTISLKIALVLGLVANCAFGLTIKAYCRVIHLELPKVERFFGSSVWIEASPRQATGITKYGRRPNVLVYAVHMTCFFRLRHSC
jgi:hypothetical protein